MHHRIVCMNYIIWTTSNPYLELNKMNRYILSPFSLKANCVTNRFSMTKIFSPQLLYILAVVIQITDMQMRELMEVDGVPLDLELIFRSIWEKNITSRKLRLWVIKSKQNGASHIRSNTAMTILIKIADKYVLEANRFCSLLSIAQ